MTDIATNNGAVAGGLRAHIFENLCGHKAATGRAMMRGDSARGRRPVLAHSAPYAVGHLATAGGPCAATLTGHGPRHCATVRATLRDVAITQARAPIHLAIRDRQTWANVGEPVRAACAKPGRIICRPCARRMAGSGRPLSSHNSRRICEDKAARTPPPVRQHSRFLAGPCARRFRARSGRQRPPTLATLCAIIVGNGRVIIADGWNLRASVTNGRVIIAQYRRRAAPVGATWRDLRRVAASIPEAAQGPADGDRP